MFIPLLVTFLKNNWKIIAIGLAIASLMGYIGFLQVSRDHYKEKAETLQLVINQAKAREEDLRMGNAAITQKYLSVLDESNKKTDKILAMTKEKIKNDKELNSIRVSLNAIRLFNESKSDPTSPIAGSEQGDDGSAEGATTFKGVSLSSVFDQVATNDAAHWKCVSQVKTWQKFWKDYEDNYNGVTKNVSP